MFALSRRAFLKGAGLAGSAINIGLPPLAAMFNSSGTAYAAGRTAIPTRFVLWFNGNGIPEKYWIPAETGRDFAFTPCLNPLAPFREDIHIITGTGPWEKPEHSYHLSHLLALKGVRHHLDDWGPEGGHDWPYWKHQMWTYLQGV